jgi:5'-nucleotidase
MAGNLTILVDVDNVLENLNMIWVQELNKKYQTDVKMEDITDWEIKKFFPGLSKSQVFSPLHKRQTWDYLEPIPGSQDMIKRLINEGHEIILVTASHPQTVLYKFNFLDKYFPFIPFQDVIVTSRKQMVRGDVLIDDAPHNLESGEYKGILMDMPYNRNYDEKAKGFIRVHNWNEIYEAINKITAEG